MRGLGASLCVLALLLGANPAGAAGSAAMTPMNPGFHQLLKCNQGYVTLDVAPADPHTDPHAVLVTTALAIGPSLTKTTAIRSVDSQGNIYALGYIIGVGVVKRFPRRLLLPAAPPRAGEATSYFNITGTVIEKRFEGTKSGGFVFSDYVSGRKLNSVVYAPGIGLREARFLGMAPGGGDMVCHLSR
jgi:hypothetical protein